MNKANPVYLRNAMEAARMLTEKGIEFVPIPVKNDEHRQQLVQQMKNVNEDILREMDQRTEQTVDTQ